MLNRKYNIEPTRQPQKNSWDLTDEELKHNQYHCDKLADAYEAKDEKSIFYHRSQILGDPGALMAVKINSGSQFIRDNKLNTTLADRKFGHDWLSK